jgi:transcriptional regulator with XRE-family HTH domain
MKNVIFGVQIRAARALVGWSQDDLAVRAGIAKMTVNRFETSDESGGTIATLTKMKNALEAAGVIFIDPGPDGGPGVRLSKWQN